VGRADLVDTLSGPVFASETFGGSPDDCAVASSTVRWLMDHPESFEHLSLIGESLKRGYTELGIRVIGQPERSTFVFSTDSEWIGFCSRMIELGIMVHRPNFISLSHSMGDVDKTLEVAQKVLSNV